jgi:competence protein ComEA
MVLGLALVAGCLALAALAALLVLAPEPRAMLIEPGARDALRDAPRAAAAVGFATAPGSADRVAVDPLLVVDVAGAVARPGLVRIPAGSRVGDAIAAAGGFAARADLAAASDRLNLAAPLEDGAKVLVPELGSASRPDEAAGATRADGLVDLNRATQAELEELPGIGPVTAGRIMEARAREPFGTIDELRGRGLVGAATFGKLREMVTASR